MCHYVDLQCTRCLNFQSTLQSSCHAVAAGRLCTRASTVPAATPSFVCRLCQRPRRGLEQITAAAAAIRRRESEAQRKRRLAREAELAVRDSMRIESRESRAQAARGIHTPMRYTQQPSADQHWESLQRLQTDMPWMPQDTIMASPQGAYSSQAHNQHQHQQLWNQHWRQQWCQHYSKSQ